MEQVTSERDAAMAEVSDCKVGSSGSHHVAPIDAFKQALSSLHFCSS